MTRRYPWVFLCATLAAGAPAGPGTTGAEERRAPAAKAAGTPEGAATRLVQAMRFWAIDDYAACLRYLAEPSRHLMTAVRDSIKAGRALDAAAAQVRRRAHGR